MIIEYNKELSKEEEASLLNFLDKIKNEINKKELIDSFLRNRNYNIIIEKERYIII